MNMSPLIGLPSCILRVVRLFANRQAWLSLVIIFFTSFQLTAQKENIRPEKQKMSFGLSLGTKSLVGGDFCLKVAPKYNVRVGFNYMQWKVSDFDYAYQGSVHEVRINGNIHHSNVEFLVEREIKKGRFRVVGGLAVFYNNTYSGKIQLSEGFQLNDLLLTPEEVGFFKATVTTPKDLSPYLGLAIGEAFPFCQFNVSLDVGAYYKGPPRFDIEATNLLRSNVQNEEILEEIFKSYRFWPVVSLRVAYLFS